jgi:iron complex outermembrane recepter protein
MLAEGDNMQKLISCLWAITTGVLLYLPTLAQTSVSGRIIDAQNNLPLAGATIKIGNFGGTTSDSQGRFSLQNLPNNTIVEVSYIGYEKIQILLSQFINPNASFALKRSVYNADEVIVSATRATEQSAIAFSNTNKGAIDKQNLGQDLPILLNFMPSLVTTSDAGAGVGYTGLRIRGTDATRINVTVNGIPLNDAESHGVYWVNMPDFASSVSSVQVQRGVGTSTNGAAAFGASVNVSTNDFNKDAYADINNSMGSFNTYKHTLKAGTGLLNEKFTLDARLSKVSSDGFVDRAASDLKSFYVSGGYFGKKSFVRLNVFSGNEKTYQAWEGVPEARLKNNREGILAYIDRNYLNPRDADNLLHANDRTYNLYLYDNQTDNYQQDHYQVVSSHQLSSTWTLNLNAFVVHGRGYYEQFKDQAKLTAYKLPNLVIGTQTIKKSDIIRRRWLDNIFYGNTFSLDYNSFGKLKLNIGGGWNRYEGQHFGEIVWAQYAGASQIRQRYYENSGLKTDINIYAKAYYQFNEKLTAFADIQQRRISYRVSGDDSQQRTQNHEVSYDFTNPKVGLTYQIAEGASLYGSVAVANREPNRDDFTESTRQIQPQPEKLIDFETGYRIRRSHWAASMGGYLMNYKNQLVVSGQLNDVGNPIKINVPESYRAGVELEVTAQLNKKWQWNANATLSQNQVKNFTEYIIDYDDPDGGYQTTTFDRTDIAFSPRVIVGSQLVFKPLKNLELGLLSKYVGQQYLDNTSNSARTLDAYFTNDLRLIYDIKPTFCKQITISALANNILDHRYESNGYTYSYIYDKQTITENFYYPQAGRSFLVALGLKF